MASIKETAISMILGMSDAQVASVVGILAGVQGLDACSETQLPMEVKKQQTLPMEKKPQVTLPKVYTQADLRPGMGMVGAKDISEGFGFDTGLGVDSMDAYEEQMQKEAETRMMGIRAANQVFEDQMNAQEAQRTAVPQPAAAQEREVYHNGDLTSKQKIEVGMMNTVQIMREAQHTDAVIRQKLMDNYKVSEEVANRFLDAKK